MDGPRPEGTESMTVLYLTIALIALLMTVMAVGVILSDRELKGSCGGTGINCECDEKGIPRQCETDETGRAAA